MGVLHFKFSIKCVVILQDASPSHILVPGQVVRCVVSSLNSSRDGFISLRVSINPKDVNKELSPSSLKAGMVSGVKAKSSLLRFESFVSLKCYLPLDHYFYFNNLCSVL